MEIDNDKLSGNYQYDVDDISTKSNNNFEFIRERKLYNDYSGINNMQSKPYNIMDKTYNLFGTNLNDKIYSSLQEQKENIDLFSNQNDIKINDNNNIKSNMNIIQNTIKNDVNQITKDKFDYLNYDSNFETNRINNNSNSIDLSKNKKTISNKGFYFNYKSDESFNKLNEQNIKTYPIDIKYNSIYKKELTNFSDNFDYRKNIYMSEINQKENNEINEDIFNYNNNAKELINKNSFKSLNINYITNSKDDFNEFNTKDFSNINNNIRFKSMSVNKNMNAINQKKLNLDYNEDNIDIKPNKISNINNMNNINKINITQKFNNDSFYDPKNNIKSYFQLTQEETAYNNISLNNNKKIDYQNNDNSDNLNNVKSLRKYNSFSVPKNFYINHKKEENYNIPNPSVITVGNSNTRDEMTQTNQIIEDNNRFYSFTQNRNYRNKPDLDIVNNINKFSTFSNRNLSEINDNENLNEKNQDEYNKKVFNTSFNNNRLQQNKCIHKCNSYRNNNNYNFSTFNKSNKNNTFNDINRNICKKCLRAKMNLANLSKNFNNMRICKNCQNFINSRNLINYFTVNK